MLCVAVDKASPPYIDSIMWFDHKTNDALWYIRGAVTGAEAADAC